jgi:hypothetical protein
MPSSTPKSVVYIVITSLAVLDALCVGSLCMTLFYKNYADPAVLSALIALTGSLTGSLGSVLVNTRQPSTNGTSTTTAISSEQPATVTVEPSPPPVPKP